MATKPTKSKTKAKPKALTTKNQSPKSIHGVKYVAPKAQISFPDFLRLSNAIATYDLEKAMLYLDGELPPAWETPKVHLEIADWLETTDGEPRRVLQAYRHLGKSYLLCLYIAWRLLRDPYDQIIVISAQSGVAKTNVQFVKNIMENNPLTTHLVGKGEWRSDQFRVAQDNPSLHPSVRMLSLNSSITGKHGNLLIGDDLEVAENVNTEKQRMDIRIRIGEMSKLADELLFIGTPHCNDDIYSYLVREKNYNRVKFPVTTGGVDEDGTIKGDPICPELGHDLNWIESKKRDSFSFAQFKSQYYLIPTKQTECVIDADYLQNERTFTNNILPVIGSFNDDLNCFNKEYYLNDPVMKDQNIRMVEHAAYWDPGFAGATADDSVLAIIFRDINNNIYVENLVSLPPIDRTHKTFRNQCEVVCDTLAKYHINIVKVEENFNVTLRAELLDVAKEKRLQLVVLTDKRQAMSKDKYMIKAIEPVTRNNKLWVRSALWKSTPIASQLENLGSSRKDDFTDALSGAIFCLTVNYAVVDYDCILGVSSLSQNDAIQLNYSSTVLSDDGRYNPSQYY